MQYYLIHQWLNLIVIKNNDIELTSVTIEAQEDGAAIAMRKGSTELQTEINKTIKRLKDEGKIDEFVVEANKLMD